MGERRFATIDKHFDGEEGYITWYCQEIEGKIYPLQGNLLIDVQISGEIFQIEYHHPFLFVLFKTKRANGEWNETGTLKIIDVRETNKQRDISNVIKFFVFESSAGKTLGIFHKVGGTNRISSATFDNIEANFANFTFTTWFSSGSPPLVIDVMVADGRIFILAQDQNKFVAFFSQYRLNAYCETFFESSSPFFTFPEYFFLLPASKKILAYAGYLVMETGVWRVKQLQLEGVLQYIPEKVLEFPINPAKINVQIPSPFEVYISQESQTIEANSGKMWANFYVSSFLSNSAEVSIKNELLGSILFKDETKRRIDYSLDELVILIGDILARRYNKGNQSFFQVFYLSSQGTHYYDGKLYFISFLQDYMHTKYVKRVKIRRFQDIWNLEPNITKIFPPPFPFAPHTLISDEEHSFGEEWSQTRATGKAFIFEFEPNGILPVLDIEYDLGK